MKHPVRALSFLLCLCLLVPLAASLFACSSEPATENRMTAVVLEKGEIRAEAVLTKGFLDGYTEKKVYLFELPSVYSTDADLYELDPVAEVRPKATVKFTLSPYDGVRSRLHSSYLVASYDPATRRYTPLTTPMSLSNPEAMADYAPSPEVGESSIKGLISDHPADAVRLGISHTVVDVRMDRLILSAWQEGAVSYIYNGVTRYLDAKALNELDETVRVYTSAGVKVYLRFRLGDPTGKEVPLGLYFTAATASGAEDFAVNMSTAYSAVIMEGFFDYMAERYAAPIDGTDPVNAFIVGYRVNDAATYNNAGGLELAAYVTNYEKLTRIAHTALRSHNPDGQVYISLDSRRSVTDGKGWDVAAFLSAFKDESVMRGDYDWQISCELHAATSAIWEENPSADAAHYTVRNLNTLTDLLDSPIYRAENGEPRRLLISGFAIPAVAKGSGVSADAANKQAASYAYAYMTCVQNGRVEALIYSTHTDPASTADENDLCGLWTVRLDTSMTDSGLDLSVRPAAPRPIYDVFAGIDTTGSASLSAALTDIIGASYTKLESALAGKASPVTAVKGSGTLKGFEAEHKKAAALFTFGDGHLRGFESAGNLTYLELTEAETLGLNTLHARFDRTALCEPMGLTVTLPATDLIGGKEMVFDLFAGQLASEASSAKPTVTLRLTRAAKGSVADGDGEILYEASVSDVKAGSWQTAVFHVTEFTSLLDASDEVTLTLLMDYPLDNAPDGPTAHNLGLAGIYITGNTAAAGTSAGLVVGIIIVLILLVAGVFVFLYLRHRRKG